jgi:hypothetical protein
MKKILLILIITAPITVFAQESDTTYWKKGGVASVTFSQVTLNNWAAGGNNSIAYNSYFNVFANYKKGRSIWENNLELGYGLIKQDKADFVKSDDKINLTTKYGRQLVKDKDKLYWSMNFNLRTQFNEGFNPDDTNTPISKFMAPGYLTVALGLDWKPSEYFSLSYAPLTGKITVVNDQNLADVGAYGVDPAKLDGSGAPIIGTGTKSRKELGSYLTASFKKEIFENVNLTSNLQLFSNYANDPKGIDVNWENALLMKINKFLSASIINQLIYDNDIKTINYDDAGLPTGESAKVQLKNIFGLGLAYTFGDKL